MKIEKSEIASKLGKLKSILAKNISIESLKGVLVDGNSLVANNLEIAIRADLNVQNEERFLIPPKAIEMIEALPDGEIEIVPDSKGYITVKASGIKNKYKSLDVQTFPDVHTLDQAEQTTLPAGELQDAIASVLYAVPGDSPKPAMNGVYFKAENGTLDIVGCDGYRIAWCKLKYAGDFSFIVPKQTIQRLLALGISGDMEIIYNSKMAMFKGSDYEIYTRLIEGKYMDFKKVFTKHENSTIVNRQMLLDSVHRALICLDNKEGTKAPLIMHYKDATVNLTIKQDLSEYEEMVLLNAPVDSELVIGFNTRYLYETIRAFASDTIEIFMGTALQPVVIDDGDLTAMVLPCRLQNN